MITACIALMQEVWNPYGSQSIELVGGVGAMRNKRGEIMEESLLQTDAWEFRVGYRPPIWCFINAEGEVTLSKYSAQWERINQAFEDPPENNS
jgi:hypothetical protein